MCYHGLKRVVGKVDKIFQCFSKQILYHSFTIYSRNLIKRVLNGIFHGFNSLSGGSVSNTPEKPRASDKVIVTGLAFFIFIVVVAYGGSNAANLVNDREIGE